MPFIPFGVRTIAGAEKNQTEILPRIPFNNSQAWVGSTYEKVIDGVQTARDKDVEDKIIIGFAAEGLPFQIIVDAFPCSEMGDISQFIDEFVMPLMGYYIKDLKAAKNEAAARVVTEAFIKRIYEFRASFLKEPNRQASVTNFTMSLAVSYEKKGALLASGFGVGNNGIAKKGKDNSDCDQLVHNTKIAQTKDAFDNTCHARMAEVIRKCDIFTTVINREDELVGYTHLDYGLEEAVKEGDVLRYSINPKACHLAEYPSLYQCLIEKNEEAHRKWLEDAREDATLQIYGDDSSFAQIIVPTADEQNSVAQAQFITHTEQLRSLTRRRIKSDKLKQKVLALLEELDKEPVSFINNLVLSATLDLLLGRPEIRLYKVEDYQRLALELSGHRSPNLQKLGLAMLALGIVIAGITGMLVTGGAAALVIGTVATASGTSLLAGIGAFFKGRRSTAASKAAEELVLELWNDAKVLEAPICRP